jgi:hypothetical protein
VAVCLENYGFYGTVYIYIAVRYMLRNEFYSAFKVYCPGYDFLDSTRDEGPPVRISRRTVL